MQETDNAHILPWLKRLTAQIEENFDASLAEFQVGFDVAMNHLHRIGRYDNEMSVSSESASAEQILLDKLAAISAS